MLSCPICAADCSETGLRDGRCPRCGSVVAWNETDSEVPRHLAAAVAQQTLHLNFDPRRGVGAALEELKRNAAANANGGVQKGDGNAIGGGSGESSGGRPPTVRPKGTQPALDEGQLTPEAMHNVSAMWDDAARDPGARPSHTLKGATTAEIHDTHLVIQKRSVKRPAEPLNVPAEYELLDVIGAGGVGIVYAARQASIDRNVAIKMLKAGQDQDAGNRDKFLAEAVVTGDLDHPNIVPIYDLGSDPSGSLFYSMKHVRGTPWADVLLKKSVLENLEILMKVSDAIAFAHARGVVHRDIKPENVMLGDYGEVLVMDWGIALPTKEYSKSGGVMRSQGLGGTPAYMAPEMVTGPIDRIGPPADIYLLGAVLFEMITGYPPHTGKDAMDCVMAAAKNEIAPTDKSGELLDIALRAMNTSPRQRYASVRDFQAAIRDYQSHNESIALSSRAEAELVHARQSQKYEDLSRAMFAFEEAFALWDGNSVAYRGMLETKLAYAECALQKEDFDLGLSLVVADEPSHEDVRAKLLEGQRERNARLGRLRRVKQVVALLLGVLIVGGIGTSIQIYTLYKRAELARGEADVNRKTAEKNAETALRREKDATDARGAELRQRVRAEVLGVEARRAQAEVQEKSYFGEIALANEEIDANAFEKARELLDDHTRSVQAKYLHWEWGRLRFLCRVTGDKSVRTSAAQDWPVETLAVADRTSPPRVVLAGRDGQIALFHLDTNESLPLPVDWQTRRLASIASLAFTPDQRWLAIAGSSVDSAGRQAGRVQVWRVEEDRLTFVAETSRPLGRQVRCIATAADSRRLVLGADDHSVRIWRWPVERSNAGAGDEAELPLVGAHLAPVHCVAIAGDSRRVASGGEDGTVRVWRAATEDADKKDATAGPGELARFRGHKGSVFAVAFSPNGRWVASGGFDRRVLVWESPAADAKPAPIVKDIRSRLRAKSDGGGPRTSGDGRGEVGAEPSSLDSKVAELPGQPAAVRCLAFDGSGELLLSAGQDNVARIWRLDDLKFHGADRVERENTSVDARRPIKELRGHGSWVTAAHLSADGRTVVTGSYDRTWRWWDVEGYSEYRFVPAGTAQLPSERPSGLPSGLPSEPPGDDDMRFVSSDATANVVAAHDSAANQLATDPRVTRMSSDGRPVLSARYLPSGERIVTASEDGVVSFWTIGANKPDATVSEGHRYLVSTGVLFPSGERLLTAAADGMVRIWDIERGIELSKIDRTGSRGLAALARDGRTILTGSDHRTAQVWRLNDDGMTAQRLFDLDPRLPPVAGQGRVSNQEAKAPSGLKSVAPDQQQNLPDVSALAISPDSRYFVTGESRGIVRSWDAKTGAALHQLSNPSFAVTHIAFQPGSEAGELKAYIGYADGRIRLWEVATGRVVGEARHGDRGSVSSLVVSADGRTLVTASPRRDRRRQGTAGNSSASGADGERQRREVTNSSLWVWDAASLALQRQIPLDSTEMSKESISFVSFRANSTAETLVVTTSVEQARPTVWSWPLQSGTPKRLSPSDGNWRGAIVAAIETPAPAMKIATSGTTSATRMLTVGGNAARLWSLSDRLRPTREREFRPHGAILALDVSRRDGEQLLVTAGADGSARLWDLDQHAAVRNLTPRNNRALFTAAFSPTAEFVAAGGAGGAAFVWNTATGQEQGPRLKVAADRTVLFMLFTRDGRLVTGDDKGLVQVWPWRPDSPREPAIEAEREWLAHANSSPVRCAALSGDGQFLLTGSDNAEAFMWELASGRKVASLEGHAAAIRAVAVSNDGLRALTASAASKGSIKIWNLLPMHRALLNTVKTSSSAEESTSKIPAQLSEILAFDYPKPLDVKTAAARTPAKAEANTAARTRSDAKAGNKAENAKTEDIPASEIRSISFSPDGRDVLTADVAGNTIVWPGDWIEPAIDLPFNTVLFTPGVRGSRTLLARDALISFPCPDRPGGEGATSSRPALALTVSFELPTTQDEETSTAASDSARAPENSSRNATVAQNAAQVKATDSAPAAESGATSEEAKSDSPDFTKDRLGVWPQALPRGWSVRDDRVYAAGDEATPVAQLRGGASGLPLQVEFAPATSADRITAVVRALDFDSSSNKQNEPTRTLVLHLRRAGDPSPLGNPNGESCVVQFVRE